MPLMCITPEDIEDYPNEFFMSLAHELIDDAVEEQMIISSNTCQPRRVGANPTLLTNNKRIKGSTANVLNQGR